MWETEMRAASAKPKNAQQHSSANQSDEHGKKTGVPPKSYSNENFSDLNNTEHEPDSGSTEKELTCDPSRKKRIPCMDTYSRCRCSAAAEFTNEDLTRMGKRLKLPVPISEASSRPGPGGTRVYYVEGWKVINEANHIFGFNGWSLHVLSTEVRSVDETGMGRFTASVSVHARVSLRDGTVREDRGGGICEHARSKGEAILKAEKEAVTDATKRALKNFGDRLGLCLYNRAYIRAGTEMTSLTNRPAPVQAKNRNGFSSTPKTHHA